VRRHIHASSIWHIGKEANRWEEQFFTGIKEETLIEYGRASDFELLDHCLRETCKEYGERKTAERLGISRSTLRKAIVHGSQSVKNAMLLKITKNNNTE